MKLKSLSRDERLDMSLELKRLSEISDAPERETKIVKLHLENLTIRLYVSPCKTAFYDVDLEQIKKPYDALEWIIHLREKVWFTPEVQDEFLYVLEEALKSHTEKGFYNKDTYQWKGAK